MPGALAKISTSRPESSAKHIIFALFEKCLAFISEFSRNDFPFSAGLLISKSSGEYILRFFGTKSLISLSFPLLFVPINSFVIFLFSI